MVQANAYAPTWGQTIFQSANEMMNNAALRKIIDEHQSKLPEEREWWDRKRSNIQEGFMKELDGEGGSSAKTENIPTSKSPEGAVPTLPVQGSDDDAVLVEADESAAGSGNATGGGGGGKKKKKGKK